MDHEKIYKRLCDSRKYRGVSKGVGYELHHVVPRSMGGSDDHGNLVKLTPREHLIAHILLEKFTRGGSNHIKMLKALNFMVNNNKYPIRNGSDYARIRGDYLIKASAIQREVIGKPALIYPLDYKYFKDKVPDFPVNKYFKQQAKIIYVSLKLNRDSRTRHKEVNLLSFYLVLHAFGYKGVKITTEGVYYRTAKLLESNGITVSGIFQPIITNHVYTGNLPSRVFDTLIPHEFPRGFKGNFINSGVNNHNPLKLIMVKISKTKECVELYPVNNWLRLCNPISEYFYKPIDKVSYEEFIKVQTINP